MTDARTEELRANLSDVRGTIAAVSVASGRSPDSVTLIAVTKTWPVEDVRRLASLGVADVGENRAQEAAEKARGCADITLRWHFIGQLQTNKARMVAGFADVVHGVDRARLITALDRAAADAARSQQILLQVSLAETSQAPGRAGAEFDELPALIEQAMQAEALTLVGVMGVAPLGVPVEPAFLHLARASELVVSARPEATWISAGMSADFETAIACGATHVRLGSAVLGNRPPLR